ncbi:MAG: hypothetical protein CSB34_07200 [Desulfobulbus propionicus]|nr:MAG: hypothetical protein CSB34_07200 [Desulfobulbus propionicus]
MRCFQPLNFLPSKYIFFTSLPNPLTFFHCPARFDWNMKPYDLDDDRAALQALGINPVATAHQLYLTFEAYF